MGRKCWQGTPSKSGERNELPTALGSEVRDLLTPFRRRGSVMNNVVYCS